MHHLRNPATPRRAARQFSPHRECAALCCRPRNGIQASRHCRIPAATASTRAGGRSTCSAGRPFQQQGTAFAPERSSMLSLTVAASASLSALTRSAFSPATMEGPSFNIYIFIYICIFIYIYTLPVPTCLYLYTPCSYLSISIHSMFILQPQPPHGSSLTQQKPWPGSGRQWRTR